MNSQRIFIRIASGRTDAVLDLLTLPNWKELIVSDEPSLFQWLIFYNDVTALRLIEKEGLDVKSLNLNNDLCDAAFFVHWIICDFLLNRRADVNLTTNPNLQTGSFMRDIKTCGEIPLHRAAAYADEEIIRLLLEHGADKEKRDSNGDAPLAWGS